MKPWVSKSLKLSTNNLNMDYTKLISWAAVCALVIYGFKSAYEIDNLLAQKNHFKVQDSPASPPDNTHLMYEYQMNIDDEGYTLFQNGVYKGFIRYEQCPELDSIFIKDNL